MERITLLVSLLEMSLCLSEFSFPELSLFLIYFVKPSSYLVANSISDLDIDGEAANAGAAILINFIKDTRSMLQGMGLSSIPVGNSDAGSYFNKEVLAAVDYGVRPYLFLSLPSCFITHFVFKLTIFLTTCAY